MAFTGDDIKVARETFERLSLAHAGTAASGRRYWELVAHMQALCRQGFLPARNFMAGIDVALAPAGFDRRAPLARPADGPTPPSPRPTRAAMESRLPVRPPRRRTTDRFAAMRGDD